MNSKIKVLGTNLSKSYWKNKLKTSVEIFSNIDIMVPTGYFVAILGPSGCGKSTMLKILSSMDIPNTGVVKVNDQEVSKLSDRKLAAFRRKHVGFIFQSHLLLPELTVLENVSLPLRLQGISNREAENTGMEMLERVGLAGNTNKKDETYSYPHEISIGQQQRVGIARALIHKPDVVFADEPTGSLDEENTQHILEMLLGLQEEYDTTIIMVTHDPHVTRKMDGTWEFCQINGKLEFKFIPSRQLTISCISETTDNRDITRFK